VQYSCFERYFNKGAKIAFLMEKPHLNPPRKGGLLKNAIKGSPSGGDLEGASFFFQKTTYISPSIYA
jgi:hypothetical protein